MGPYLLKRIAFQHHRPSTYCYIKANQAPALCSCQKRCGKAFQRFAFCLLFTDSIFYVIQGIIYVSSTRNLMTSTTTTTTTTPANISNNTGGMQVTTPEHFICSISGEIFKDPVIASDGQTYERESI